MTFVGFWLAVRHAYRQNGELAVDEEPTLLFRYSAIIFNSHRIHYDWPYVTDTDGYAGLVVHGPLIATLLARAFTNTHPRARVNIFSFRSAAADRAGAVRRLRPNRCARPCPALGGQRKRPRARGRTDLHGDRVT